ncbi:MAG: DNA sulfur modification protein DndD [Ignavibacteria bacterium]|nr:DNA sulfur modification protein DndD [Ignavibacteria bacterium]
MFINAVRLKNFRIYYGINELTFTKSIDKNIFIIAGNNGYGKTTLLTALVWCLYGKAMSDVDDVYKVQVNESGGYKKYASSNLNKLAAASSEKEYSVEIVFSDISIPTFPCNNISIRRVYNNESGSESLHILIDGNPNELTKEVGPEIFINDFILPKELAKFFFFDAEKIVNLAEIKTIDDKRRLSRAYSEIIGIKKYEDLKSNLEGLRIRLKRNSASDSEIEKFKSYSERAIKVEDHIDFISGKIQQLIEEQQLKKNLSNDYQERLIREGNVLSQIEYQELIQECKELEFSEDIYKQQVKDLLELAPFAIASNLLEEMKTQAFNEAKSRELKSNFELIDQKLSEFKTELPDILRQNNIPNENSEQITNVIFDKLKNNLLSETLTEQSSIKILHNFTESQLLELNSLNSNLRNSYSQYFKQLLKEYKLVKQKLFALKKRLSDAESKDKDLLVQKIKGEKKVLDDRVLELEREITSLKLEKEHFEIEKQNIARLTSELAKKINVGKQDLEKDQIASRLIDTLEKFLFELKKEKKDSLESGILRELSILMHKDKFVHKVKVLLTDELIEVELYDFNNQKIQLESLSKGEQQLYATALLKALVDESNVKFPVFIDSPLQKFDQLHSRNIICEFYPNISEQVVIFPLLKKELAEEEYKILLPKVNSCYFISNYGENRSRFDTVENDKLFVEHERRSHGILWN